jgi:hypothetical protein
MLRISGSVAESASSCFGARNLGPRRAIGLHRVDQRIELGELARDLDVFFGIQLAQQFGLQRGVVGEQDIEFGFG